MKNGPRGDRPPAEHELTPEQRQQLRHVASPYSPDVEDRLVTELRRRGRFRGRPPTREVRRWHAAAGILLFLAGAACGALAASHVPGPPESLADAAQAYLGAPPLERVEPEESELLNRVLQSTASRILTASPDADLADVARYILMSTPRPVEDVREGAVVWF